MTEEIKPAPTRNMPPLEIIRERFTYDPETGKVFWKGTEREMGSVFKQTTNGKPAGIKTTIGYLGKIYNVLAHRIGWRLTHGDIPDGFELDHVDRDPTNNKLSNLRLATHAQNMANSSRYRTSNRGLPRGVTLNGKKFQAQIKADGKLLYLGSYETAEEASAVYRNKAKEVHGEFFAG